MNKPYLYSTSAVLRDYECDSHSKIKLGFILKHAQHISTEHLDSMGLSYQKLYESGIVFLLAKIGMRIYRRPESHEEILVTTSPQSIKGAQFLREVYFHSTSGEKCIELQSSWLIVNPHTRKILRPNELPYTLPHIPKEEDMLPEAYAADRIKPNGEIIHTGLREVLYSDIDVNKHLNNTIYADIITDFLPIEQMANREVSRFVINYHQEARHHETLSITTRMGEDGWYYVSGFTGENCCFEGKVLFD